MICGGGGLNKWILRIFTEDGQGMLSDVGSNVWCNIMVLNHCSMVRFYLLRKMSC